MTPSVECIVKLGGSAITVKDRLETAKLEEIRKTAEFLKLQKLDGHYILVHGAGSFGHFQAKEYAVAQGYDDNTHGVPIDQVQAGFCKTRVSVTKLNHIIVNELVTQGIKAVGLSPCGRWVTENGQVVQSDTDSVKDLLREGYQPVLHGDCVIDRHKGCTILSGDTIIEVLCAVFQPKRVIFLADVEGIFDKPPSNTDARLLPVVTVTQEGCLSLPIETAHQKHDVTGGILTKLKTAVSIVKGSEGRTSAFVCGVNTLAARNAFTHGDLLGEKGTEIKMEI